MTTTAKLPPTKASAIRQILNTMRATPETTAEDVMACLKESFPTLINWDTPTSVATLKSQVYQEMRGFFPNKNPAPSSSSSSKPSPKVVFPPTHETLREVFARLEELFLSFESPEIFLEALNEITLLTEMCGGSPQALKDWAAFLIETKQKKG